VVKKLARRSVIVQHYSTRPETSSTNLTGKYKLYRRTGVDTNKTESNNKPDETNKKVEVIGTNISLDINITKTISSGYRENML
jgi:hypothetical protein